MSRVESCTKLATIDFPRMGARPDEDAEPDDADEDAAVVEEADVDLRVAESLVKIR